MAAWSSDDSADRWALPRGAQLDNGNIVIREVLGVGGFGITYRAQDSFFGEVALKEFMPKSMVTKREGGANDYDVIVNPDKRATFDGALRQFWREPRIMNTLNHPHIVKVLYDFQENGTAYYAMRLLKGMDLAKWIQQRRKPLDYRTASSLLFPIMDALIYMHRAGTYHRDISPSNVFLERTGDGGWNPCLIDFGAAYSAQKDFTHTFNRVYNKNFSPPEQSWDGRFQGAHSDVYAFCATFYYAMSGVAPLPPIDRGTDERDALRPLIEVIPGDMPPISKGLSDVVMNGLKLNPEMRTRNMEKLKEAFDKVADQGGIQPVVCTKAKDDRAEEDRSEGEGSVQSPRASPRPVVALLLDWLMFCLVYVAGKATGIPWTAALGLSACFFLIVNGLLAGNGATVGQRIAGCSVSLKSKGAGFPYTLVRMVAPVALVDECFACGPSGRRPITKGLFADGGARRKDGEADTPDTEKMREKEVRARLRCVAGEYSGKVVSLDVPQMFGRGSPSTLVFQDGHISSHHCLVRRMSEKTWHVIDMDSKNGTYLNGSRLPGGVMSQALKPGDRLKLCNEIFIYEE